MIKKENIQINDVLDKIIDNMDTPIFTYNQKYNYDEMWSRIKKEPLKKERVMLLIKVYTIITIIVFFISNNFNNSILNLSTNYIFLIFICFILSLVITIQLIKQKILQIEKKVNNKSYFYKTQLIIKTKNEIFRYSYNKISKIEEIDYAFILYFDRNSIIIEKNKIDNNTIDFLTNLKTNYEKEKFNNTCNENVWDNKFIEGATLSCDNDINLDTINQFCNLKSEKRKNFSFSYFYVLIVTSIISWIMFPHDSSIYDDIIFFFIFIELYLIKESTKRKQDQLIKDATSVSAVNFKLYFYDNFILLKTNDKILKCEYNDIKSILDNDNYIFIKFKSLKLNQCLAPIIIDKSKLKDNKLNYLLKKNNNKNG